MASDRYCTYRMSDSIRSRRMQVSELACHEPPTTPVLLEEGHFCIFHYPRTDKNLGDFCDALQQKCNADYRGFVFPVGFATNDLRLEKSDFTDARFLDLADFSNETFVGPVQFEGVTFVQKADFRGATFRGEISFAESRNPLNKSWLV